MDKSKFSKYLDKPCFRIQVTILDGDKSLDLHEYCNLTFQEVENYQAMILNYCAAFDRDCLFKFWFDTIPF